MDKQEFRIRRESLTDRLAEQGLNALAVSAAPNIRYLCGFTGSNGLVLVSPGMAILLTDPRYEIQAARQTDCKVRVVHRSLWRNLASIIRRKRFRKIGFESASIHVATLDAAREFFPAGAELIPTQGIVELQRAVKSTSEISLIRQSVETCSKAFARALRRSRPGIGEYEVAAELDHQMRKLGAEKPAFETIAASGPRSALPHAESSQKTLNTNELLLIDMGAQRQGYNSDMTRMIHLGRPSRKARKLHSAVLEAQLAALDAVRANVAASTVDRKARQVLRSHGLDSFFVHSTGHGLGLEIHEFPRIAKSERIRLKAGMVITIEPGVYIEGFGGVRIEDTAVVTDGGCQILTPTSKELLVI